MFSDDYSSYDAELDGGLLAPDEIEELEEIGAALPRPGVDGPESARTRKSSRKRKRARALRLVLPEPTTSGHIQIPRERLVNVFRALPSVTLKVFVLSIGLAGWRDRDWHDGHRMVKICRGSFPTTRRRLAEYCGCNESEIRTALRCLESFGLITYQTSNAELTQDSPRNRPDNAQLYTLVTISNYDSYQPPANGGRPDNAQDVTQLSPSEYPANQAKSRVVNSFGSSNKRRREEVQEVKKNTLSSASADEVREWFENEFWPLYPKKEAKLEALNVALQKACTPEIRMAIVDGLKRLLPGMKERELRFIPLASKWLEGERYNDEPESRERKSEYPVWNGYQEEPEPQEPVTRKSEYPEWTGYHG